MKLFWKMVSIKIIFLMLNCVNIYAFNPGNGYTIDNNKVNIDTKVAMERVSVLLNYDINGVNPAKSYLPSNSIIRDNETLNEDEYLLYIYDTVNENLKKAPSSILPIALTYLGTVGYADTVLAARNRLTTSFFMEEIQLGQLDAGNYVRLKNGMLLNMMDLSKIGQEISDSGKYWGIETNTLDTIIHLPDAKVDISLRDFFINCAGYEFVNDGSLNVRLANGMIITPRDMMQIHLNPETNSLRFIYVNSGNQVEAFMVKYNAPRGLIDYARDCNRLVDRSKISEWKLVEGKDYRGDFTGIFYDHRLHDDSYLPQMRQFELVQNAASKEYRTYKLNTLKQLAPQGVKTAFVMGVIADCIINIIVAAVMVILLVRNSKW